MKQNIERIKYMIAFTIYGTVGILSHYIQLPTGLIILIRSILGMITIGAYLFIKKDYINFKSVKENLLWLALAGLCLGGNWIFLFTSYVFTSVAIGTLCNYLAPSIIILLSPLLFKEQLSAKKLICVFVALFGLVCISGIFSSSFQGIKDLVGILIGLGSAFCYVGIIVFNKKLKNIKSLDKSIVELFFAGLIMFPYALITSNFKEISLDQTSIILVLILGIVHTGITYVLYFGSMEFLDAQSIAVLSYIEPVLSVTLSYFILHEEMNIYTLIGAIAIIGATFVSEYNFKSFKNSKKLAEKA